MMLTVKHAVNGMETIYSAPHGVRYDGPFALNGSSEGPMVSILALDGIELGLSGGTVYVMNDHGSTVGTYKLGAPAIHGNTFSTSGGATDGVSCSSAGGATP